ncbi:Sirtuin family [Penicillium canariense]|uniref:NAD-dependent protein deacetylase n=1 Tax=Penicillium canariense TaxID=189055 RepID=A0A9W9HQX6_9EURO|nr:Sirtuin family [Penicillium canariense]KAJ5152761.1 Sirtuin family [Penicillium canariense]
MASSTKSQNTTSVGEKLDMRTIASRIKDGQITRIVVLLGAGISTAAGIPDFRSPNTGLYDKLAPLHLPYPEAVFHISYFAHTPEPFYAIARARHPGNLQPTASHAFLALLAQKKVLHFIFTQNIDGLEQDAGVPADKILWAHGNWKSQHCWKCKTEYPDDLMQKAIRDGAVPYCQMPECGGAVKPDVVFFGQSLPLEFDEKEKLVPEADLMLVMGTSLKVAPCSRLPRLVQEGIPRVLINMEKSGDFGSRNEDVCILGSCDEGVRKLAHELGWSEDLDALWRSALNAKHDDLGFDGGPTLDECIAKVASQMDSRMKISKGHKRMLETHLASKFAHMGLSSPSPPSLPPMPPNHDGKSPPRS